MGTICTICNQEIDLDAEKPVWVVECYDSAGGFDGADSLAGPFHMLCAAPVPVAALMATAT